MVYNAIELYYYYYNYTFFTYLLIYRPGKVDNAHLGYLEKKIPIKIMQQAKAKKAIKLKIFNY